VNPLRDIIRIFKRERARFAYWQPLAMAGGIILYFSLAKEPPLSLLALTPVLGGLAYALSRHSWGAAILLYVLFLASMGFSAALIEARIDERPMLDSETPMLRITGRVYAADIMPDALRITLLHPRFEKETKWDARLRGHDDDNVVPEKIRIKFNELTLDDAPPTGAEITFVGKVYPVSEPVAPYSYDFRRQAYYNHLGGVGWSRDKITILNPAPEDYSLSERFSLALERTRKTISRHVYERLPSDVAAITAARLNGEQTGISSPVMDALRTAGLIHLLATSGANVTVMALLIYFPLRALLALVPFLALRYPIKKWASVAAVFSALGYTFLVGSPAATMRSMVMVGLAMLAILVDRLSHPLRLVMISAFLSMLFAPSATVGASFQMSFAAVFCLVAAARVYEDSTKDGVSLYMPDGLRPLFLHAGNIMRASVIATAATTPFTIYHFQTFNLYGLFSNILAIPLTSFWVMPFTILAFLAAPIGWDGFFIDMAGLGNALTIRIATTVAAWPKAILYMPAMPSAALLTIVIGGFWLCLWRGKVRHWGWLPIVLAVLYPLYTRTPDLFVAPDGKQWGAVLEDGRLAVASAKRNRFTLEQWKQRLGNAALVDAKILPEADSRMRCDDEGCIYRKALQSVFFPKAESAIAEGCGEVSIIVAPFDVGDCGRTYVIDAAALRTHGSHAVYFGGDMARIEYTRDESGGRPWSVGWKMGFDVE